MNFNSANNINNNNHCGHLQLDIFLGEGDMPEFRCGWGTMRAKLTVGAHNCI